MWKSIAAPGDTPVPEANPFTGAAASSLMSGTSGAGATGSAIGEKPSRGRIVPEPIAGKPLLWSAPRGLSEPVRVIGRRYPAAHTDRPVSSRHVAPDDTSPTGVANASPITSGQSHGSFGPS